MLVLDAGDSLVGDQDPARKTQGRTSVEAMNMMGYDAVALGAQDLSLGATVLQQRMAEARFAVLSANAVTRSTGKPVAKPYVMRELGRHRVAIIGLSDANAQVATPDFTILDPLKTAQAVVPQLATQADVLILLSHAGMAADQQIAESVPGIALIISGGPSAFATPWRSKSGTLILHADEAMPGHAGRVVGIAALAFENGQLIQYNWQQVGLDPKIADDAAMRDWVQKQFGG